MFNRLISHNLLKSTSFSLSQTKNLEKRNIAIPIRAKGKLAYSDEII